MAILVERGVVNFTEAGAVMVHCPDMALMQIVGATVEVIGAMRGKSRQHGIDISLGGDERVQRGVVGLSHGIFPGLASRTHVACECQHSKSVPRLIAFDRSERDALLRMRVAQPRHGLHPILAAPLVREGENRIRTCDHCLRRAPSQRVDKWA